MEKEDIRCKRPLCMHVMGMPIFWHTIMSYKRGLFALFILFPGNARSLLMGWLQRKLPRLFVYIHINTKLPDFGSFYGIFYYEAYRNFDKKELERQERSVSWFARKLSCDRSNVYRLFQKENIDTGLLTRISLLLNHDFCRPFWKYKRKMIVAKSAIKVMQYPLYIFLFYFIF